MLFGGLLHSVQYDLSFFVYENAYNTMMLFLRTLVFSYPYIHANECCGHQAVSRSI